MPSKNELWSARVAHVVQHAAEFGTLTSGVRTDMQKVLSRKQDMIEREIAIHLKAYKESGAKLIMGSGRFVGPKTIEVALNDGGAFPGAERSSQEGSVPRHSFVRPAAVCRHSIASAKIGLAARKRKTRHAF
jgi:hypothetical protein